MKICLNFGGGRRSRLFSVVSISNNIAVIFTTRARRRVPRCHKSEIASPRGKCAVKLENFHVKHKLRIALSCGNLIRNVFIDCAKLRNWKQNYFLLQVFHLTLRSLNQLCIMYYFNMLLKTSWTLNFKGDKEFVIKIKIVKFETPCVEQCGRKLRKV